MRMLLGMLVRFGSFLGGMKFILGMRAGWRGRGASASAAWAILHFTHSYTAQK